MRPRFQRVGYKLQQDQNGVLSLYRKAEPYVNGDPLADGTFTQVASGIKGFQLSYLDPKDKTWKDDTWAETDRIPIAVRVRLDLVADPSSDATSGYSVADSGAPHYETVVGLGAVLAPQPDPVPAPGASPPAPG